MSASSPPLRPNLDFGEVVAFLETDPRFADAVSILQDLPSDTHDYLMLLVEATRLQSELDGQIASAFILMDDFGISYVCFPEQPSDIAADLQVYAEMDKHSQKAAIWLGLGTFLSSPDIVEDACFSSTPWKPDARLDAFALVWFRLQKPNRNEPCWCGSG